MNNNFKYIILFLLNFTPANSMDWHRAAWLAIEPIQKSASRRTDRPMPSDSDSEDDDKIGSLKEFIEKHTPHIITPQKEK